MSTFITNFVLYNKPISIIELKNDFNTVYSKPTSAIKNLNLKINNFLPTKKNDLNTDFSSARSIPKLGLQKVPLPCRVVSLRHRSNFDPMLTNDLSESNP